MKKLSRVALFGLIVFVLSLGLVSLAAAADSSASQTYTKGEGFLMARSDSDTGVWIIDYQPYAVTTASLFEEGKAPEAGVCVEFYFDERQTITYIEQEPDAACAKGPVDVAFGLIESMPAEASGVWTIGGMTVASNELTQFGQWDGEFAAGVCAELAYMTTPDGLVAHAISTSEPYHCQKGVLLNSAVGLVDSMPVSLYGFWTVDGMHFAAGTSARFSGTFAPGSCVAIDYFNGNGRFHIDTITQLDSAACDGRTANIQGKVYGRLQSGSFPQGNGVGNWRIGGDSFVATAHTRFNPGSGVFQAGVCVHAEYVIADGEKTLVEVETQPASRCEPTNQPEFSAFGVVEAMPITADRSGTWQVNGLAFTVDGRTQFEEMHGALSTGSYVELYYVLTGTGRRITKIEVQTPAAGSS